MSSSNAPQLGFDLIVTQRGFWVIAVMLEALLDLIPLVIGEGCGFFVDGFPDAFDKFQAFLHAELADGFQVDGYGGIIARRETVARGDQRERS